MKFNFVAKTKTGEIKKGIVEASSYDAAVEVLKSNELIPVSITEVKTFGIIEGPVFKRVKLSELVFFTKSLSALIDAGVPLVNALESLYSQTSSPYFKEIISKLASDVRGGVSFSKALSQFPNVFSKFYIAMIRVGEVSGNLQSILEYLAGYLENDYMLKSKIKAAMRYPVVILFVFFIVLTVVSVFVLPKLAKVFETLNIKNMPFTTRLLLNFSENSALYGSVFFFGVLAMVLALYLLYKNSEGFVRWWHKTELRMPIFGPLLRKIYQARFAENMSTLIKGGVPILEAIQITSDVIGNKIYEEHLQELYNQVKVGKSIDSVLKNKYEFDSIFVEMVAIGETSGKLDEVLKKVGSFYNLEIDTAVKSLSSLIEPILIVFLGLGVGTLVLSVLVPIFSSISQFQP